MPIAKETKYIANKGINTNLSNRFDHIKLSSNMQIGDNNNENTENTNIDENIEKQITIIHDVHGNVHVHSNQGQLGGSASQRPNTKNYISTEHAVTVLFALLGLAVISIAIGIAVSCVSKQRRRRKKNNDDRISRHQEITQSNRELNLLNEITELRSRLELHERVQSTSRQDKIILPKEESRNEPDRLFGVYPSLSDVSEI